ncbi:hypothetical protein BV96_03041 [Sphingomonas paucimobilis]|nr:hypothetical protein BV96_03041 [Sphingomonas paucimobilis]
MNRRPYSYSVLRYVHDIVTGEFVNVGLVFFAPSHQGDAPVLLTEFKDRIQRLRHLFPDIDRPSFTAAIDSLRRAVKPITKDVEAERLFSSGDARSIAVRLLPHDGSSLQWSEIGTGIAKDVNKEFHRIADRMLSRYDRHSHARRTDDDVWRPVHQALVDRRIAIEFEPKVIRGTVDAIEFTHSWKNGQIHAYEPLSFDLAEAENIKNKARKWMGHLSSVNIGASDQFKAYFIAGKPSDPGLMPAYETALEILRAAPSSPAVYEEGDIDELINVIEDDFRHHQAAQ